MRLRIAAILFVLGCNATANQLATTFADGAKAGSCIIATALSGGDPAACVGATAQLIADVITDFETKNPNTPAADKVHLEAAKVKALSQSK